MRKLSSIFIALFLFLPLQGQEMEKLSYVEEVTIPGAQPQQLYETVGTWYKANKEPFNILISSPSIKDHIWDFEVNFWDYKIDKSLHSYDMLFHVYIACQNNGYVVELTDIIGRVDSNTLSGYEFTDLHWDYMTQDPSGVRGGLYGWYWRKHDKKVRQWLENYFRQLTDSLYEAMTAE